MSTAATPPAHRTHTTSSGARGWDTAQALQTTKGVPFGRLVLVELRKMVDTRAGRWLLIIMALFALLVLGANVIWGRTEESSFHNFLQMAMFPLSLLLPVIGVMSATSEWSQRTGLSTFTLEPRRGRIIAAKILASLILGLIVTAIAVLGAVAATAVAAQRHSGIGWSLPTAVAAGMLLALAIGILQGLGFGFALLNTPLAITTLILLPTVITIAGSINDTTRKFAGWIDMNQTTTPLIGGEMDGDSWTKLGASVALWVLLPLLIGVWRVLRREVK